MNVYQTDFSIVHLLQYLLYITKDMVRSITSLAAPFQLATPHSTHNNLQVAPHPQIEQKTLKILIS